MYLCIIINQKLNTMMYSVKITEKRESGNHPFTPPERMANLEDAKEFMETMFKGLLEKYEIGCTMADLPKRNNIIVGNDELIFNNGDDIYFKVEIEECAE